MVGGFRLLEQNLEVKLGCLPQGKESIHTVCSLIVDHRGYQSYEKVSHWMNISVRPLLAQAAFFSPEKK